MNKKGKTNGADMTRLNYKILEKELEKCKKIGQLKQNKTAVLTHHGWYIMKGKTSITQSHTHPNKIQICFTDLITYDNWYSKRKSLSKHQIQKLKTLTSKVFGAKVLSFWLHTQRGISIVLDAELFEGFLRSQLNYLTFRCDKCDRGVFCDCGVLNKRRELFKSE